MAEPILPQDGNKGFLDSTTEKISSAFESTKEVAGNVLDVAIDTSKDIVNFAEKAIEDPSKINILAPLFSEDERKNIKQTTFASQADKDRAKKFNEVSGWDMISGVAGSLSKGVGDYVANSLWTPFQGAIDVGTKVATLGMGGTDLMGRFTNKLQPGVSLEDFNKKIQDINSDINNTQNNINNVISIDPKFKRLKDFYELSHDSYLKERGITTISDKEDYQIYLQQKMGGLNPFDQQEIVRQQKEAQLVQGEMRIELTKKQQEQKDFLEKNIKPEEGKTAQSIFEEYQKEEAEARKGNEFLKQTDEMRKIKEAEINGKLAEDAKILIGAGANFEDKKNQIIDDATENYQYYISVLGMTNVPDNEKLAEEFKKSATVQEKFNIDMLRTYSQINGLPENKGLSQIEINEKARAIAYARLTPEEVKAWSEKANQKVAISGLNSWNKLKSRSIINPMQVLDVLNMQGALMSYWADSISQSISQDIIKAEVPWFVKQDARNIEYSAEGNFKKFQGVLLYNMDTVAATIASMKVTNVPVSKLNQVVDKLAKGTDVMIQGPKIGYGVSQGIKLAGTTTKGTLNTITSGAATDPIFDISMSQAPNKASDEFNFWTNIFFDAVPYAVGKGTAAAYTKSANEVMYRFLDGDTKDAIKEMKAIVEAREGGVKLSDAQTASLLSEQADRYMTKIYNPEKMDKIFKTKGELYRYIAQELPEGTDSILSSTGFHLSREDMFGVKKGELNNLSNLISIRDAELPKGVDVTDKMIDHAMKKKALARQEIFASLEKINNFVDLKDNYNGVVLSKSTIANNKQEFERLNKEIKKNIITLRSISDKDINAEDLVALNDNVNQIQKQFSTSKTQTLLRMKNMNNNDVIQIAFEDIKSMDGLEELDLMKLIKAGKVTIEDGKSKVIKPGTYELVSDESTIDKSLKFFREEIISKDVEDFVNLKSDYLKGKSPEERKARAYEITHSIADALFSTRTKVTGGDKVAKGQIQYLFDITDEKILAKEIKAVSDLMKESLGKYIGPENIGGNIFIPELGLKQYINKDKPLIKGIADTGEMITHLQKQDSMFNIVGGYFTNEKGELTHSFYLSLGSKVVDNVEFTDIFKKTEVDNDTKKIGWNTYLNKSVVFLRDIIKYGADETGKLNIEKGIKTMKVLESTKEYDGLFKDGVLDKDMVYKLVDEALDGSDNITPELKEFIYSVFSDVPESQAITVVPMIKNLAMKYYENKPLINEMFRKFDPGKANAQNFISAFANIILSPKLYKTMADNIKLKPQSETLLKGIRSNIDAEWNKYFDNILAHRQKLQEKIDQLKIILKSTHDQSLSDELETLKFNIAKLDKFVSPEKDLEAVKAKFIADKEDFFLKNLTLKNIKEQAGNFAFTAMIGGKKTELGDYSEGFRVVIDGLDEQIKNSKKMQDNILKLSSEDRAVVGAFLKEIDGAKTLTDQVAVLKADRSGNSKIVNEILQEIVNDINKGKQDLEIIDVEAIDKMVDNFNKGIFNHEFATKNNPIEQMLGAFINNSNSGQDENLNKAIRDYFGADESHSAYDMYHLSKKDAPVVLTKEGEELLKEYQELNIKQRKIYADIMSKSKADPQAEVLDEYKFSDIKKPTASEGMIAYEKLLEEEKIFEKESEKLEQKAVAIMNKAKAEKDMDKYREEYNKAIDIANQFNIKGTSKIVAAKDILMNKYRDVYLLRSIENHKKEVELLSNRIKKDPNTKEKYDYLKDLIIELEKEFSLLKETKIETHSEGAIARKQISEIQARMTQINAIGLRDLDIDVSDLFNKSLVKKIEGQEFSFAEMVDDLFTTQTEDGVVTMGNTDKLSKFMNSIITSDEKTSVISIFTDKSEGFNYTKELLDEALASSSLIDKFKAIKNSKKFFTSKTGEKIYSDINITTEKTDKGYDKFVKGKPVYNESIIQLDNMLSAGMNVKFMRGLPGKKIGSLGEYSTEDKKFIKISGLNLKDEAYQTSDSDMEIFANIISGVDTRIDRKKIMDQLGIEEGYYFMGGFGDKDSAFTFYQPPEVLFKKFSQVSLENKSKIADSLFEYEYAFSNQYYNYTDVPKADRMTFDKLITSIKNSGVTDFEGYMNHIKKIEEDFKRKFKVNIINDIQAIKKREASNMSAYKTFEGVIRPLTTYVIKKDIEKSIEMERLDELYEKGTVEIEDVNGNKSIILTEDGLNSILTDPIFTKDSKYRILEFITETKRKYPDSYLKKVTDFINTGFRNDNQDGTSYVSKNLETERAEIRGIKSSGFFKDHFFGDTGVGRFFGKTLFNAVDIELDGKLLQDTVIIGESSMKLKGGYTKYSEEKTIFIDGKSYQVIGEVQGTNTSFFKEASSDSYKVDKEVTVGSSVQSVLPYKYANAFAQEQIKMIKEAYDKTVGSLGNHTIKTNAYSSVQELLGRIQSTTKTGMGTSTALGEKLKGFFEEVDIILNKSKETGTPLFIRSSSFDVSPEEMKVSPNSELGKQVIKEINDEIIKLNLKGAEAITKRAEMMANSYSVGYRFPVPSRHNMALLKIKLDDTLPEKQVVLNPITTYIKMAGDHDGDKTFFVSARGRLGSILGKSIVGKEINIDLMDYLLKEGKDFRNSFIIADEVVKSTKGDLSLKEGRFISYGAKESVGIVSAFKRTIGILKYITNKYNNLSGEEQRKYGETKIYKSEYNKETKKYGQVLVGTYESLAKKLNFIVGTGEDSDILFDSLATSILNKAVDFGNSGAATFDKKWMNELAEMLNLGDDVNIEDLITNIITPISVGFNQVEFNKNFMIDAYKKSVGEYVFYQDELDKLNLVAGSKRDIMEDTIEKYSKNIAIIDRTFSLEYLVDYAFKNPTNKVLRTIVGIIRKEPKYIETKNIFFDTKISSEIEKAMSSGSENLIKLNKKIVDTLNEVNIGKKEGTLTAKEIEIKKQKLYEDIKVQIKELNDEERTVLAIKAYMKKDYIIENLLSTEQKIKFFIESNKSLQKKGEELGAKIEVNIPMLSKEYNTDILKAQLDEMKLRYSESDDISKSYTENEIRNTQGFIDRLENFKIESEKEGNEIMQTVIEEQTIIPDIPQYNFPEIELKEIDRSPQSFNEVLERNTGASTLATHGLKLTLSSLFTKYAPEFYAKYESIRNILNNPILGIREANKHHVNNMGPSFFAPKSSIYKQVKATGLDTETTTKIIRQIERALLGRKDGKFTINDLEAAITSIEGQLKNVPSQSSLMLLIREDQFKEQLKAYQTMVIGPVANALNHLETTYAQDILKMYKGADSSIVIDVLEGHKANPQLALKMSNINSELEFDVMLKTNSDFLGGKIWDGTRKIMAKVLFNDTSTWIEKLVGFMQSLHYSMTYGTVATYMTQNNIIMGLAQIPANYVELKNYSLKNSEELDMARAILQKYRFGDSEDVIYFGGGHGLELNEGWFSQVIGKATKSIGEGIAGKIPGVGKDRAEKAGLFLDSFANNILGFNDWPLEQMRKETAVLTVMQKLNFKTKKELDDYFFEMGRKAQDQFGAMINVEFANNGGGIVSNSAISRGTVFSHLNLLGGDNVFFNNWLTQFAVKSVGYLMGWSFHKSANLLEKEFAMVSGVKLLIGGDVQGFKAHMNDFLIYNAIMAKQIMATTALFMKFQKYERDNQDRMDLASFQKSFQNTLLSVQGILLGRHIGAWNTADEMGATTGEKLGYTTYTMIDRTLRIMKQPQFFDKMYDHYRGQEALGKGDMVDSFYYTMNLMYTSGLRMSGMEYKNDIFNSVVAQGNLGILGYGGETAVDDIFSDEYKRKDFADWKKNGTLLKIMATFNGIIPTKELGFQVGSDLANDAKEIIIKDPNLRKLTNGGELGVNPTDYNIERVLGKKGQRLTPEQAEAMDNIWKEVQIGSYQYVDERGNRVQADQSAKGYIAIQEMLEKRIEKELKASGHSMEDLITNNPNKSESLLKTLAVLQINSNLKTPAVLAAILGLREKHLGKKLKDEIGKETGEVSDYNGEAYKALSSAQKAELKRDLLIEYQSMFNLSKPIVEKVIEQDILMHHKDLVAKIDKVAGNNLITAEVMKLVNTQYKIANIQKNEKDVTSVTKLNTRYALAMKGLDVSTETGAEVAIKFLKDIENLPFMDAKTKLAHQSAVIYGLNKTQYQLLKDNEKFNTLTEKSQKQLTNWMYKISSDTLDYDSKSYMADLNQSAGASKATGGKRSFSPGYKSKAMSGQRPNFAQQFDPVRSFLPGKQQYISDNPREFLKAAADFGPQTFGINNAKFPIMQEYSRLIIQNIYYGYKSKGIIPSYVVEPKVDLKTKKYINLKKPKKAAGKQSSGGSYKVAKKVSGGAWAGMPLSNIQK